MRSYEGYEGAYQAMTERECLLDSLLDMGAALIAVTTIAGVVLAVL